MGSRRFAKPIETDQAVEKRLASAITGSRDDDATGEPRITRTCRAPVCAQRSIVCLVGVRNSARGLLSPASFDLCAAFLGAFRIRPDRSDRTHDRYLNDGIRRGARAFLLHPRPSRAVSRPEIPMRWRRIRPVSAPSRLSTKRRCGVEHLARCIQAEAELSEQQRFSQSFEVALEIPPIACGAAARAGRSHRSDAARARSDT
jgi:hypothetical protein